MQSLQDQRRFKTFLGRIKKTNLLGPIYVDSSIDYAGGMYDFTYKIPSNYGRMELVRRRSGERKEKREQQGQGKRLVSVLWHQMSVKNHHPSRVRP